MAPPAQNTIISSHKTHQSDCSYFLLMIPLHLLVCCCMVFHANLQLFDFELELLIYFVQLLIADKEVCTSHKAFPRHFHAIKRALS